MKQLYADVKWQVRQDWDLWDKKKNHIINQKKSYNQKINQILLLTQISTWLYFLDHAIQRENPCWAKMKKERIEFREAECSLFLAFLVHLLSSVPSSICLLMSLCLIVCVSITICPQLLNILPYYRLYIESKCIF